jgi:hypothetical protein
MRVSEEKTALTRKLVTCNEDLTSKKTDLSQSKRDGEAMTLLADYLNEKLAQLNSIVIENDQNSTDYINYTSENAVYYNDELQVANYRFGKWETVHEKTKNDYNALWNEMDKLTNSLNN